MFIEDPSFTILFVDTNYGLVFGLIPRFWSISVPHTFSTAGYGSIDSRINWFFEKTL